MATIDNIKTKSEQVRDATEIGENTAERVGGILCDLADVVATKANTEDVSASLSNVDNRLETLEGKDIVLSESAYNNLSSKDESKFYFVYEEE